MTNNGNLESSIEKAVIVTADDLQKIVNGSDIPPEMINPIRVIIKEWMDDRIGTIS